MALSLESATKFSSLQFSYVYYSDSVNDGGPAVAEGGRGWMSVSVSEATDMITAVVPAYAPD